MELPPGLTLSIKDKVTHAEAEALGWGLEAFNEAAWPGHQPWQELGLFLRKKGHIVAGLVGQTYAGWFFIQYFWIAETLRRGGLGAHLMALAEQRAVERGCHSAYLDTFSFQAPEFYRKQGYDEFARLPYPPKGERIWLRKSLVAPEAT